MIGREQIERLWQNVLALGKRRLIGLAIIGGVVFASVGLIGFYFSRPELETLYGGLSLQDVNRIGAVLNEAGIYFDVSPDGAKILVRRGQTAQARMLLAEKGLPTSANAGYELFDNMGSIGLTSFMQEITRVRALEGEIARTIQAVKGVKAARVHLVLPDQGAFRRNRQTPSASVVIRTETTGDFTSAQAIRHLVAAAVPELTVDQVTVLTTDGAILAAAGDASSTAPTKLVELEKTISRELQERARKTLAPYLGIENFEVSVAARLNTDRRQINETAFDPESRVERSVRIVRESGNSQNHANRTPVSVEQNIPDEEIAERAGDISMRSNEHREELTNYELNTKSIATISDGYRIETLTVAVVVNRARLLSTAGQSDGATLESHIAEIEKLVSSAVGLVADRGDRITVAAVDFFNNGEAMEPVGVNLAELLVSQSGTIVNALAILGATALLVWFGLRPAVRAVLEPVPPVAAQTTEKVLAGQAEPRLPEPEPNLIADLKSKLGRSPQKRLEQMVDFDEEQAVAVFKKWMREARQT